jgi:hypothetical protein
VVVNRLAFGSVDVGVYAYFEELATTEYTKTSGKGTGLSTAYKCKKCNENVQQIVGSTSNLSDHLQRCDFTAWDRDINSSKSNSHTAQVVDTEGSEGNGRSSFVVHALFVPRLLRLLFMHSSEDDSSCAHSLISAMGTPASSSPSSYSQGLALLRNLLRKGSRFSRFLGSFLSCSSLLLVRLGHLAARPAEWTDPHRHKQLV